MHVLIAGCGWLGQAVAAALLARGDRVTGVRRDPARAAALAPLGVAPLAADLTDPAALERLPGDVDAVVACQSARADGEGPYRDAYVRSNETLLALARRRPLRAFVYTGSTGVFGQRDGEDVDETTPPDPRSPGAEVLVQAERLVLGAAPGVPARLVRLSGLYGPGRAGILERVRGGALALGPGDGAWMNFCHRDDAVAFVLAALDRGRDGGVYHGSDARPARRREVVTWVAAALGIPPARREEAPAGPDRRILSERSRRELGLTLSYPSFAEGVKMLLPR
ncbi:NAD-dependent epimerase/dehydratase family protein [Anaeromyxobacter paludicola]|uniref:NAD(P)-dependent oxidoreductase n=1 Tax=Anaeromyxobacter paludicola TaxID=2918171 RepID=A0ABN6N286_9BACT|nr:NAD-dependent epimerase/dehydratase family protein [Anaeromyxobacter paludicola]BDG07329.1 NAD(P)-dependent oxidoreductase [Anaeromyxobacter paludicola]